MEEKKAHPLVFRQVAFTLASFDYLKEFQRGYVRMHGTWLNNNEALAEILTEHKNMTEGSGEHRNARNEEKT